MHVRHITEHRVDGKRLGRHVKHDPRSLRYLYRADQPRSALASIRHERKIPVLDQGEIGSCTGNATEGALGTAALFAAIPEDAKDRPSTTDADLDERQAVAIYSGGTGLDDYQGTYPPEDTGCDGLSVAKFAQSLGLISGYRHCTTLDDALAALAEQPVIAGINWYDSFDEPDHSGRIKIGKRAQVRGGHEVCLDELDVEHQLVGFTNSWGTEWGLDGRAYLSWADLGRLLKEEGDVTVFTPLTEPAPTPAPVPADDLLTTVVTEIRDFIQKIETVLKNYL